MKELIGKEVHVTFHRRYPAGLHYLNATLLAVKTEAIKLEGNGMSTAWYPMVSIESVWG